MVYGEDLTGVKVWSKTPRTLAQIETENRDLEQDIAIFNAEIELEAKKTAFRETYEAWYDERITLEELLAEKMRNGLCRRIGVWRNH